MAYINQTDLLGKISETDLILTTDDTKAGIVNQTVLSQVFVSVDALINSYVGVRYSLPLATIPDLLKEIAKALAVFLLFERRRRIVEDVRQRYEDAIALLKDIAASRATLGLDPPPTSAKQASQSKVLANESEWSRKKLENL